MLFGIDVVTVFHYQRMVIAEAFRAGRLPVWDPHVMAGFPLLAGVQGAVFYPPSWLCVVLSAGTFWTVSAWFHFILAGAFAHRWLERGPGRRALGGAGRRVRLHDVRLHRRPRLRGPRELRLGLSLDGGACSGGSNGSCPRRPGSAGCCWPSCWRCSLLAGVPQYVYFAGLVMGLRGIHFVRSDREGRRERGILLGKGAAWLAMGLLLCAPQLFPTLELVGEMHRGGTEDPEFAVKYSMPPEAALEIVWPPRPDSKFWEQCAYLSGGAVLLLAAAFLQRRRQQFLWLGIALFGLLMAMGRHTPLYPGWSGSCRARSCSAAPAGISCCSPSGRRC
jgi:hypothetical protein